jgi:two-component system CheB/CheR fusion protein
MLLHKFEVLPAYVSYLKKNIPEVKTLYNDLLINVTHFFRDPEANAYLKQEVLPELIKARAKNMPLRVWVPACSTGEEVYTIAIIILEVVGDNVANIPIQIFGTDLSEMAVSRARAAVYAPADLVNVSPGRLQKFFSKIDGHYRLNKYIRDLCVFATHNVFKDPPFSRVDIVSCCNLLIYLEAPLQKKILANFHYSLNSDGYLILGQSETVGASVALFSHVQKKVKIYTKKTDVTSRATFDMNYTLPDVEPAKLKPKTPKPVEENTRNGSQQGASLDRVIDNVMLNRYTPAGIVITHALDIVQFRGSLSLYLEHSSGQASLNVLKMARTGLGLELRAAAHKVIKTGLPEKKSGIEISFQGNLHRISFEIIPLDDLANEPLMLVVFEEEKTPVTADAKTTHSKDRRVKQLEDELLALREDMRSIVEEQETANEELQSANEEIVSSNEELQSINEELETSKEELESSNEELQTINQELLVRNDQLAESQDYSQGIIGTIREGVLVLDNNLRVKAANQAFYNTFKISEKDTEGKWVYNLCNNNWNIGELKKLLEDILPRNGHFNGYRIEQTFDVIGEKVLMLNVRKMERKHPHPPIILLAIEDITEHSQAETLLEEREAWLRNMTNNVPVMIWVAGPDKNFTFLNKTWLAFTGRSLTKETGIGWTEGVYKDDLDLCLSTYHRAFENRTPFSIEYRMKRHDGQYRWILNSAVPTYDATGEFTGYTGSCTEIHDKRMMHEELEQRVNERTQQLQEANNNLERSNNELQQFAYVASHDLQEPLRKIITFSNRLKENFANEMPAVGKEYIEKIYASTSRMRHLIDDLLNFSRISQFEKKFVPTDLNEVLRNVLADFDLLIQEHNVDLKVGQLPVVPAVPLQINQLFHNLLSNAFKFTSKKNNPHIEVTSRILPPEELKKYPRLEPSVDYHEIVFRDNGIGFPQEFADQIFVIFQRLHDKDAYTGTGIGLALCRKIVRNHMGEITAESVENIGSAFSVILPARQTGRENS